jgi:hypothetical protein
MTWCFLEHVINGHIIRILMRLFLTQISMNKLTLGSSSGGENHGSAMTHTETGLLSHDLSVVVFFC